MRKLLLLTALLAVSCAPAYAVEVIEDWAYVESVDAMTDEDTSAAITVSNGRSLAVKCVSGNPLVFSNADTFLISGDHLPVTWRIDKGEPVTERVWVSSGVVRLPSSIMDGLSTGREITIRYTDYRGRQYTETFSLKGFYDSTGLLSCVD